MKLQIINGCKDDKLYKLIVNNLLHDCEIVENLPDVLCMLVEKDTNISIDTLQNIHSIWSTIIMENEDSCLFMKFADKLINTHKTVIVPEKFGYINNKEDIQRLCTELALIVEKHFLSLTSDH